ncbi:hypothetical protein AG1IA_00312 [Rhizoctonia solani AG-1 IA]|uniref:Uncharacterized protein n=1 Tax=Thanatephorus cucumeris (strain AG1-IA) TaxID=983506 RepID=L8X989_THACA|nr:hypothetical protein AG1IA_00312 [Rhizoctonia solani AG-1 IA]
MIVTYVRKCGFWCVGGLAGGRSRRGLSHRAGGGKFGGDV